MDKITAQVFCAREQVVCTWNKSCYCPMNYTDHAAHFPKCKETAQTLFDNDAESIAKLRRVRNDADSKI